MPGRPSGATKKRAQQDSAGRPMPVRRGFACKEEVENGSHRVIIQMRAAATSRPANLSGEQALSVADPVLKAAVLR